MIRVKKSLSVRELFNYLAKLEREEPVTPEMLERDIRLSEARDYSVMCTVKQKGCLSARLPDLSQPLATVKTEAGAAVVEGFGRAKISFDEEFEETPTVIAVPFGFFELKVPWITIEWRRYSIGWWTVSLPIPRVTEMTIRLPTMCFLMNVDEKGFEVFNVMGRTTVGYIAFGR
jgi:hypothetical protein